jgi:hypothetical protein
MKIPAPAGHGGRLEQDFLSENGTFAIKYQLSYG